MENEKNRGPLVLKENAYPTEGDIISRQNGQGGLGSSIYTIMKGVNINAGIPTLPPNIENPGYLFFTKPRFNLTPQNCDHVRKLSYLKDRSANSFSNAIRCMLMPPGTWLVNGVDVDNSRSNLVDDNSPWITLLTGSCLTVSGWPVIAPETHTSEPGIRKQVQSWMDAPPWHYGDFNLTATFVNMAGDPISRLFDTWVEYMGNLALGTIIPTFKNMVNRRIDYNTRIYRLVMDRSRKYIEGMAMVGAAYPLNSPLAEKFNYNIETAITPDVNQVTVEFKAIGAYYNDPIVISQFNRTTTRFLPELAISANRYSPGENNLSNTNYPFTKLPDSMKSLFVEAYPWIEEDKNAGGRYELEWYVKTTDYNEMFNLIKGN